MLLYNDQELREIGQQILSAARSRWLDAEEIYLLLSIPSQLGIPILKDFPSHQTPQAGDLFVFSTLKTDVKDDNIVWTRKKNSNGPQESHVRKEINAIEIIQGIYIKAQDNESFKRRIYKLIHHKEGERYFQVSHYLTEEKDAAREPPNKSHPIDPKIGYLVFTHLLRPDLFVKKSVEVQPQKSIENLQIFDFQPTIIDISRPHLWQNSFLHILLSQPLWSLVSPSSLKVELWGEGCPPLRQQVEFLQEQTIRCRIPNELPPGQWKLRIVDETTSAVLSENQTKLLEVLPSLGGKIDNAPGLMLDPTFLNSFSRQSVISGEMISTGMTPTTGVKRHRSTGQTSSEGSWGYDSYTFSRSASTSTNPRKHQRQISERICESVAMSSEYYWNLNNFENASADDLLTLSPYEDDNLFNFIQGLPQSAFCYNNATQPVPVAEEPISRVGIASMEGFPQNSGSSEGSNIAPLVDGAIWLDDKQLASLSLEAVQKLVEERTNYVIKQYLLREAKRISPEKIDQVDRHGYTLLHYCSCYDFAIPAIEELIRKKVDINCRTEDGESNSPLHLAVNEGNRKMTKFLLSADDIDIYGRNGDGENIFEIAKRLGFSELLRELHENTKGSKESKPTKNQTELQDPSVPVESSENRPQDAPETDESKGKGNPADNEVENLEELVKSFPLLNLTEKIAFVEKNPSAVPQSVCELFKSIQEHVNPQEKKLLEEIKSKGLRQLLFRKEYQNLRAIYQSLFRVPRPSTVASSYPPVVSAHDSITSISALLPGGKTEAMETSISPQIFQEENDRAGNSMSSGAMDIEKERNILDTLMSDSTGRPPKPKQAAGLPPNGSETSSSATREELHLFLTTQRALNKK